jgi:hypothetical protein
MKKAQTKFITLAAIFCLLFASAALAQKQIAIIDAGSSGSRLNIYTIKNDSIISSISKDDYKINISLCNDTSLDEHKKLIGKADKGIEVYVLATAGMRMCDKTKAEKIYKELNSITKGAMTISGQYEGFYAWLATCAKIGSGKLDISKCKNLGIIEAGGASVQQAYVSSDGCENCVNHAKIKNIYSKSYLGSGVNFYAGKKKPELQVLRNIIWYNIGGGFYKAEYKDWLFEGKKELISENSIGDNWTAGAALDIVIYGNIPEKFNFEAPN